MSGRLRHRVTIKSDSSTDSELDPTYTTFMAGIPCDIVPTTGGEKYRGKQLQAETQYVIETRFYTGFLPNMIAVNEMTDDEYTINRIIDDRGRSRLLLMEATEVVV